MNRRDVMMRTARVVALPVLALGLISAISGCTSTTAVTATSSPTSSDLCQVVKVGNRELTFSPPAFSSGDRYITSITITVRNSGQEKINRAEFDVVLRVWEWEVTYGENLARMGETEGGRFHVALEGLAPGQVRSLLLFSDIADVHAGAWIWVEDVSIK
ncbi:MAG: hypothetical protein PHZ21_00215 [Candidatus Bipolaricaulis sp.]|nr:hypothetical protein [Candidatus Bipolaricaulis sp.]